MSDDYKNTTHTKDDDSGPIALDLNFVPDWARKPPQTNYFSKVPKHKDFQPEDRKQRSGKRDNRKENRGNTSYKHKQEMGLGRESQAHHHKTATKPMRRERVDIPAVDVRFFPVQKAILEIARKIKASKRAYPMMQIAALYLDNPESCNARVDVKKDAKDLQLLQCRLCGMIAIKEETLNRHMTQAHMADYMDKEDCQNELPTGNFSCIAQCGYSGTLLGPPNHHSYAQKIREIHNSRYHNMSLEQYTAKIKTVHDKETVETWKEEYSRRTSYRPKGKESGESMSLLQAEAYFLENIAQDKIQKTHRATLPVPLCRDITDMGLQIVIKDAWMHENSFPSAIMTALRGAFLSKGMAIFRTKKSKARSKGITFVTPIKFSPINIEHVVDEIKEVLLYLKENPGTSRKQLIEALRPDAEKDSEQVKEITSPLGWLIDRGHIIEFFDGTLSVPR